MAINPHRLPYPQSKGHRLTAGDWNGYGRAITGALNWEIGSGLNFSQTVAGQKLTLARPDGWSVPAVPVYVVNTGAAAIPAYSPAVVLSAGPNFEDRKSVV